MASRQPDCPLCAEPLDATDLACRFCSCGYQLCLWCYNRLWEASDAGSAKCPGCRASYDRDNIQMVEIDPDA